MQSPMKSTPPPNQLILRMETIFSIQKKPQNELEMCAMKLHECEVNPPWAFLGSESRQYYKPCHMPSSDSPCSLHLFPPRMPRERGVQHEMALWRHCREQNNVPHSLHVFSWITTHAVKISWSWSGGLPLILFFFSLRPLSLTVTDRARQGWSQEMAQIISDGIEAAVTQKACA